MDERILQLLEKTAIEDQIKLYAHLVDSKQFDRLDEVAYPDAWIDYTASGGAACTAEEMKGELKKSMKPFMSEHVMCNVRVDLDPDGLHAKSDNILFNPMIIDCKGEKKIFFVGLHYDIDWEKDASGVWKIRKSVQKDSYTYYKD